MKRKTKIKAERPFGWLRSRIDIQYYTDDKNSGSNWPPRELFIKEMKSYWTSLALLDLIMGMLAATPNPFTGQTTGLSRVKIAGSKWSSTFQCYFNITGYGAPLSDFVLRVEQSKNGHAATISTASYYHGGEKPVVLEINISDPNFLEPIIRFMFRVPDARPIEAMDP